MNPFEMVVAIILIVMVASVIKARLKYNAQTGEQAGVVDPDAQRLRQEVQQLRERVQVLERVITDGHQSADLDRQIEQLRGR